MRTQEGEQAFQVHEILVFDLMEPPVIIAITQVRTNC